MFELKTIRTDEDNSPDHYVLNNKGLEAAVQMAIWLGKPLLLTGAPGTGKTRLAFKVAAMLAASENPEQTAPGFLARPFMFNTKTTSNATDLFYNYDAIRHFQGRYADDQYQLRIIERITRHLKDESSVTYESEVKEPSLTAHPFIKLTALGKAILQAWGKDAILNNSDLSDLKDLQGFNDLMPGPHSSVVLIDEIDKAPRDFPNDLLYEIENTSFFINELMNKEIPKPNNGAQIVVIMTSNFEKNLPDAFLRRCLFYHIAFPETDELIKIVTARMEPYLQKLYGKDKKAMDGIVKGITDNFKVVVKMFEEIRKATTDKPPATAELLEWVKTLENTGFFKTPVNFEKLDNERKEIFINSFSILAKSDDDVKILIKKYS